VKSRLQHSNEQEDTIELDSSSGSDGNSSDINSCIIVESFSPIKASSVASNSFIQIPNMCDEDYHDPETCKVPILAKPKHGLSVTQLFQLMVGIVPDNCVCYQKPSGVTYSSVVVVDLSCVSCLEDLKADDNGAWVHGGKPRQNYHVEFDDETNAVLDAKKVPDLSIKDTNVFTIVRLYHTHKRTPEFRRRISYVLDSCGHKVQFVVLQYQGIEDPVVLRPHGNAKNQTIAHKKQLLIS